MKEYNENSLCPKCNNEGVGTAYDSFLGVMQRTCHRCGYSWSERSLDAPKILSVEDVPINES